MKVVVLNASGGSGLEIKPFTGKYRRREDHLPRFGATISRADVADFMLKAVENHLASHKIVGVSN